MNPTRRRWLLLGSHLTVGAAGFAAGVYTLPILIAPPPPTAEELAAVARELMFKAHFRRDLAGSDALHWGEGEVTVSASAIGFEGRLAPGPDYRLYLSPEFVETEAEFERVRPRMQRVGEVKSFNGFLLKLPASVDPGNYTSVVIWCERFSEFITAARYR